MDDAVPQSIFVVVSWRWDLSAPRAVSILQLETHKQRPLETQKQRPLVTQTQRPQFIRGPSFSSPLEAPFNEKEYVAHFNQPLWSTMEWMFSSSTSTEDLYMLPDWFPWNDECDVPLNGCVFNFRTKRCRRMPSCDIKIGHVVMLGGCIYGIANGCGNIPFVRYDPARGFWQPLKPFPGDANHKLGSKAYSIVATAVWKDTILFNMACAEIWAYDVKSDKWCPVRVEHSIWCYRIQGVAAVLEDTIYALTTHPVMDGTLVLALSIRREDFNGEDRFVCSLCCTILVDTNRISVMGVKHSTSHLVHLGKDKFCLVDSCRLDESRFDGYQRIKLTIIKLSGENSKKSMTVIDECVHLLRVPYSEQFSVKFCFSLPECKTTAVKEGKNLCLNLDPFPKGYDPKQKFKTDYHRDWSCFREPEEDGPLVNVSTSKLLAKSNATSKASTTLGNGAASEIMYTDAEGRSISVRNLSPDATLGQFKKELMKFGASKRFEIQFIVNDTVSAIITEGCRAATEDCQASAIITEGCRAVKEDCQISAIINEGCRVVTEDCQVSAIRSEGCRAVTEDCKVSAIITEGCRAVTEDCQVSAIIAEGCRAVTEDCQVSTIIAESCRAVTEDCQVSSISTEGCQAVTEDCQVSSIITEGCRAEKEENRRIGLTVDDNRTSKNAKKKLNKRQRKLKKLGDVGGNPPLQPKSVLDKLHVCNTVSAIITEGCRAAMEEIFFFIFVFILFLIFFIHFIFPY